MGVVVQTARAEIADQFVIPESVGVNLFSSDGGFGGVAYPTEVSDSYVDKLRSEC